MPRHRQSRSGARAQSAETAQRLTDKVAAFPAAGMSHFWLALRAVRQLKARLLPLARLAMRQKRCEGTG